MSEHITICRTCLDPESRYYQICDYIDECMSIMEMINIIVPQIRIMEAERQSEISQFICEECLEKLLQCYRFQQLCIDADNQLRNLVTTSEENIETPQVVIETVVTTEAVVEEKVEVDKEDMKIEIVYEDNGHSRDQVEGEQEIVVEKMETIIAKEEEYIDVLATDTPPISNIKHFCTNCSEKFDSLTSLESHSCSKSKVRTFINCDICKRKFVNEQIYQAHMQEHAAVDEHNSNTTTASEEVDDNNVNSLEGELVNEDEIEVDIHELIAETIEEEQIEKDTVEAEDEATQQQQQQQQEEEMEINNWSELNDDDDDEDEDDGYPATKKQKLEAGQNNSMEEEGEPVVEKANDKNRRNWRYTCDVCGKVYDRISRLQRHSRVHATHKKHECDICKARFSTASYLKIHKENHQSKDPDNEKPPPGGYKCPDCPRRFEKLTALSGHRRLHSTHNISVNEKIDCNYCNQIFLSSM
ncbi:zinc finger and BTB domain-containing protein 41-like [Musca vetustissima]|uniref:zinc finger and BTB domain-containing protein 41-like n=1 Tax=Musca vetustissima TaxID=27455 RepID=UPI002AB6F264|nr:zinc finger and BTB domain-containing protein 41-like [Musca vetustissima]